MISADSYTMNEGIVMMDMIIADTTVFESIELCNNGKLLLSNMPKEVRMHAIQMIDEGKLMKAQFMEYGDSVRIAPQWVSKAKRGDLYIIAHPPGSIAA